MKKRDFSTDITPEMIEIEKQKFFKKGGKIKKLQAGVADYAIEEPIFKHIDKELLYGEVL